MKFYSEDLKKVFDTQAELETAEKEYNEKIAKQKAIEEKKNAERKVEAKEVEDLYKAWLDAVDVADKAREAYGKKLNEFITKYGKFHLSVTRNAGTRSMFDTLSDLMETVFLGL